jgi:hypothetical protein
LLTDIGNNYGIGEKRKLELKGSCASLGIHPERCVALDLADIQDNPRVWWDEKVIESNVRAYVEKWHADAVSVSNRKFWLYPIDMWSISRSSPLTPGVFPAISTIGL